MNNIRTKNISGITYYAAKDLLQLFSVSNYTLKRYVPQEDKLITSMPTTSGTQDLLAISPSGVLALAKKSNLDTDKVNRILQLLNIDIIQDKEEISDNLIPFENPSFGTIRTLCIGNDPWFVGRDVAKALGYKLARKAILDHVDKEDVLKWNTLTNGGPQEVVIINEPGLYSLILSSKLPTAKAFKHWVTHDVIPSIRKTGGYVSNVDLFVDTYLPFADEATKDLFRANLKVIDDQNKKIKEQNQLIEEQKPHVEFSKHISGSEDLISIAQMAQILHDNNVSDMGEIKLFRFLREQKVLISKGPRHNHPYQQYLNAGYFKLVERTRFDQIEQRDVLYRKTLITGKGQEFIYDLVKRNYHKAA